MYFVFRTPRGEEISDDVEVAVAKAIMTGDRDYWSTGSGDAAIMAGDRFNPVQLWLMSDGLGHFHLQFVAPDQEPVIANPKKHAKQDVMINVSGDNILLPAKSIMTADQAKAVALHFCKTLKADPAMEWR
jgi:hypothetical protein